MLSAARTRNRLLALLAPTLLVGSVVAFQDPASAVAPAGGAASQADVEAASAATDGESLFGEPLVVNGRRVPDIEIKKYLCFGLGGHQVDHAVFQVVLDDEIARRKEAGEDVSKYVVTDEEADRVYARERDDFELSYPTLDTDTEISRAFLSPELYREQSRQTLLFDKLFLPDDPDEWPDLSRQVLIEFGGQAFIDDAKESYIARKKRQVEEGLEFIPPDDPIYVETLRSVVSQALNKFVMVNHDRDSLPADVMIEVEGVPVRVDDIWSKIAMHVTPDRVEDAKRFLALEVMFEDFIKGHTMPVEGEEGGERSCWMSFSEFIETWPENDFTYHEHLNNHEMLALQVLGFPSLNAFSRYMRISESLRNVYREELNDPDILKAHLPLINPITGAAKCNVEVLLVSAYDFANVKWKENGWADAEKRANELKKELDEGADWTETLELHSEFWDPPMPEKGNTPQFGLLLKGKFGPQTRNRLISYMGESEYREFLHGPSITDYIFFDQRVGTIDGPFPGPKGYYIPRLLSRGQPNTPLDFEEPIHRNIIEAYWVRDRMVELSQQLLTEAREKGTLKGL